MEIDPQKRLARVKSELHILLEGTALRVIEDKELEEWVVNSTEWPAALLGSFEQRFLRLPREILITECGTTRSALPWRTRQGGIQSHFIALLNMGGDEKGLIRAGHERVLTARFSDAEFFWNADQKIPLADRLPMLERVTYQAKLDSYADKVRRMQAIADQICRLLAEQGKATITDREHAVRAVRSNSKGH